METMSSKIMQRLNSFSPPIELYKNVFYHTVKTEEASRMHEEITGLRHKCQHHSPFA